VLSSYVEVIKVGAFAGSIDAFHQKALKRGRFFYHGRFRRWRDLFGDNFVLRPFVPTELAGGSLLQDFTQAAFPGAAISIDEEGEGQNQSLSLQDLMRGQYIHQRLGTNERPALHSLGWNLSLILGDLADGSEQTKVELHQALARKIREVYLADAQAMDRDFFSDSPVMESALSAACDKAIPSEQPSKPEDVFSVSELRSLEMTSRLLGTMLEDQDVEWPQLLKRIRMKRMEGKRSS